MKLNTQSVTGPLRDAASVVMLRDGADALEVFLVKRHGLSDVLGGAYVFPGGKLDSNDTQPEVTQLLDERPEHLHAILGEDALDLPRAAGLFVAALREAFEETGLLYADGADALRAAQASALVREGRAFDEVMVLMGLRLQASRLTPWSRWITPVVPSVSRKRFDTRFFLAEVPRGQQATHDDHEATESIWLSPRAALQQYWDGRIELAPPQIMGLCHLSYHRDVGSALAQARAQRPPLIQPEPFEEDGVRVLCYPGDARHPVLQRALPGPTRLRFRDQRFEPPGGFDALFG